MSQDRHESPPPPPSPSQGPPPPSFRPEDSDNIIKILLATDNHIGYLERDPVRGRDAIDTFEEILKLAVERDVDFILLAGDLFHENRPSRECVYRVIALLREYTLNDKPVQIELLSDPDEGKASGFSFPAINYEDPNLNVGIPVFSIHGNHDDPQGSSKEGALCALDLISVAGLLNYMGKVDLPSDDQEAESTGLAIRPVLLRKGNTKLAMYGIGNIKDQRLHFELRSNRVRMYMPRDKQEWFNILLLHQNRVKHGPQEYVPEGMFDDSLNLVVWGHEHDCRIVPEPVAGKSYYISQPGSSVATSLSEGEALDKHVALIQVHGNEFNLEPIPLRTVRPFVMEEVWLAEAAEEEGWDASDQLEVRKYLKKKVNELIDKATAISEERAEKAVERGEEPKSPMLPLIRLKVDTTGVPDMSNPVRFGQEFQDRIANPRDLLLFTRSKRAAARGKKQVADEPVLSIDDPGLSTSEKLERVRVQTLVQEYLAAQEMQLLGETGMSDAIATFVEKDDPHAIQSFVGTSLKSMMKGVQTGGQVDEETLDDAVAKARTDHEAEYSQRQKGRAAAKGKANGKGRQQQSDNESVDSMAMDMDAPGGGMDSDDFDAPPPPPKKASTSRAKAPAKSAAAKSSAAKSTAAAKGKGRGKKAAPAESEEEENFELPDSVDEDEEEEAPPPKKKTTNRAAVLASSSQPAKSTSRAKKAAPAASKSKAKAASQSTLSFVPAGRSSGRAAATRARGRMQEVLDVDSDE